MTARRRHGNDHSRAPEILDKLTRKELVLDPTLDPWAQHPGESARNYGLFTYYRDCGRLRSVAQTAELSPISYPALTRIARSNKWAERAGAWDAEQDRLFGLELINRRREAAERQAKWARRIGEKALQRLESLNPDKISPHALVLMFQTAAAIERAAYGMDMRDTAPAVSVTTTATTDRAGQPEMRVEVAVMRDRIMGSLDALRQRMSPEQLAAGYQEITAGYEEMASEAEAVARELDAALPAPPPQ